MKDFFKGVLVGVGGISPGLSGSVLLVVLGLYQKVIDSIGNLFKDIKNNFKFLLPIILGAGVGIVLFSKVVDFMLTYYEMYTRFAFLGLILGTIPLFYKEVKKEGYRKKYYGFIGVAFIFGIILFTCNKGLFPKIENPNLFQSILLGVAVAGSSIVPGVDSAVILSTLGLYELYVSSIANLEMGILIPAGIGLVIGIMLISSIMNKLIKKYYTATFSIIFGLFLAIIPNILTESCALGFNKESLIAIIISVISFMFSIVFENIGNVKMIFENNKIYNKFKRMFSIKNKEEKMN